MCIHNYNIDGWGAVWFQVVVAFKEGRKMGIK
jgi:hypothetical protein